MRLAGSRHVWVCSRNTRRPRFLHEARICFLRHHARVGFAHPGFRICRQGRVDFGGRGGTSRRGGDVPRTFVQLQEQLVCGGRAFPAAQGERIVQAPFVVEQAVSRLLRAVSRNRHMDCSVRYGRTSKTSGRKEGGGASSRRILRNAFLETRARKQIHSRKPAFAPYRLSLQPLRRTRKDAVPRPRNHDPFLLHGPQGVRRKRGLRTDERVVHTFRSWILSA